MSHYSCRICVSENRKGIEQMLIDKLPYRKIAQRYLKSFDCDLHALEQSIANHKKHLPRELTEAENILLDRLARGEVSLEETSKIVAVKVFEKILKNPDDPSITPKLRDFISLHMVKIKEEENKTKEMWGNELLTRMFAGRLPPPVCPDCGKNFMESNNLIVRDVISNN